MVAIECQIKFIFLNFYALLFVYLIFFSIICAINFFSFIFSHKIIPFFYKKSK